MRAGRVLTLIVIASLSATAVEASPPPLRTQIRLVDPVDGFVPVAEVVTASGAVVDTFRSGDVTVRVVGAPGSKVRARRLTEHGAGKAGVAIELATSRPKRRHDAAAYARSGRTAIGDLVSLGMPEDEARRQFGDMDVMDAAAAANARRLTASAVTGPAFASVTPAATASTLTPYDTQCASVTAQNGLIEAFGCSTIYLVSATGGDWWFNNKYKFTARSKDPANWLCFPGTCPWRVFQAGWSLGWGTGNIVYDWDPTASISKTGCTSISLSDSFHGFGISVSGAICPDRLQPWNMSSRGSGAEWLGFEQGTAWESALGIQAVHSPPGAPASYSSPFSLHWARLNT